MDQLVGAVMIITIKFLKQLLKFWEIGLEAKGPKTFVDWFKLLLYEGPCEFVREEIGEYEYTGT